jgi:hypothetical protein
MKFTRRAARLTVGLGAAAMLSATGAIAATGALAAPSAPTAPQCSSSHLTVWTGAQGDAAAGHAFFQVQISNVGHSTCSLLGYPGVSVLNNNGHQVGKPAGHSGAKPTVVLAPGATSHFVLTVTDPFIVCAHPVKGSVLKVFAPGAFHANQAEFSTSVCPHSVTLHVDAVHAGAGIPGFSTS